MSESMIDRVAMALSVADGNHPDACSNDEDETPMWTLYVKDARAAIEAMRTPTEAMKATAPSCGVCGQPIQDWSAMINAALSEKP